MNNNTKNKKRPFVRRGKRNLLHRSVRYVDYKNIALLEKFINAHGKIVPASVSGVTAHQQRVVSRAIKRARQMALLPYTKEKIRK